MIALFFKKNFNHCSSDQRQAPRPRQSAAAPLQLQPVPVLAQPRLDEGQVQVAQVEPAGESSRTDHRFPGKIPQDVLFPQDATLQLHSQASAGMCDPYVVLRLVPETKFPVWPRFRTRSQRRTLFPLFDETFDFVLSGLSPLKLSDSYLQVVVKDRGIIPGTGGVFLGEALIPLRDIQVATYRMSG